MTYAPFNRCESCKFLSLATNVARCQRLTSKWYARDVLQIGVITCPQWEDFFGRLKSERDERAVVRFPGAA